MLVHPTIDRLRSIGLSAMADALVELQNNPEAADMSHADWLGLLVDREASARDNRRLSRRLTTAKLRQAATIENVDYKTARGLDRGQFQALTTSQWLRDHNHLAIVGPTGTGKSWLACALGHKACRDGYTVLYRRAPRLFADLAQARGEGRLSRMIASLERINLIILDDWGPEILTPDQRRDLLEIVDDRYEKGSLLITSQVPVSRWHDIIGDPTLGDAILDRIVHNAHRIELRGESLRRQTAERKSP
jgi:DNA replication protein DnaC